MPEAGSAGLPAAAHPHPGASAAWSDLGPPAGLRQSAGQPHPSDDARDAVGRRIRPKRVFVHVGAPKTGTSALQGVLDGERERLAARGVCYPGDRFDAHFLAALDLMQLPWGGLEREAVGAWDELAAEVRAWPGTAIVSHEILARASRAQVDRALTSLGAGGAEVHVVLSARDLARQIPAEWQENVKHRRTTPYATFLEEIRDPARTSDLASWFWSVQHVPEVLDRWGDGLPGDRVHLVTVPPAGSEPGLLWRRFLSVFGLGDVLGDVTPARANPSLGVAEAEVVRRLNVEVVPAFPAAHYRALLREHLVHRTLSPERMSGRISVPADVHRWAADLSRTWVADLALRGYDVVGSLDDLLPADALPYADPADTPAEDLTAVAIRALTAMTTEAARLRDREAELEHAVHDLIGQLDAAHSTRWYKAKERLVRRAQTNRAAEIGLAAYRRVRGRNSRST